MRNILMVALLLLLAGCSGGGGGGNSEGGGTPAAGPNPVANLVTGRVTDAAGNPASGAAVSLFTVGSRARGSEGVSARDQAAAQATTDGNGQFSLSASPGVYNFYATAGNQASAREVTVGSSGADIGSIPLGATGGIQGKVLRIGGSDHSGIEVFVLGSPFAALTDAQGNYQISGVPVGTFKLFATTPSGDASTLTTTSVSVSAGAVTQAPNLLVVPLAGNAVGSVTFIVTDSETSQPIEGVTLELGPQSRLTDATGRCTFEVSVAGPQAYAASKTGYVTLRAVADVVGGSSVTVNVALVPAVQKPTGVTVKPTGLNQLTVSWTAAAGATTYDVFRAEAAAGPFARVNPAPISGTQFVDSGLTRMRTYHYYVQAAGGRASDVVAQIAIPLFYEVSYAGAQIPTAVSPTDELIAEVSRTPNAVLRKLHLPDLAFLRDLPGVAYNLGSSRPPTAAALDGRLFVRTGNQVERFDAAGNFLGTTPLDQPPAADVIGASLRLGPTGELITFPGDLIRIYNAAGTTVTTVVFPGGNGLRNFWAADMDNAGVITALALTTRGWEVQRFNAAGNPVGTWDLEVPAPFGDPGPPASGRVIMANAHTLAVAPDGTIYTLRPARSQPFLDGGAPSTPAVAPAITAWTASGQKLLELSLSSLEIAIASLDLRAPPALEIDANGNLELILVTGTNSYRVVKLGPLH